MTVKTVALVVLVAASPAWGQATDPRVALGLVPPDVMEGSRLFFEETFSGNGRTCGTCHLAESNTTIEQGDIDRLPPDAPFFAANVPGLEHPSLIRQGIILENVDGFERDPGARSVPHTLSLSTSIISNVDQAPGTHAVGWSSDGAPAPGTLRDFATGAVIQHFPKSLARVPGVDFRLPTDDELDAMLAFQMALGRTSDISLAGVTFSDPQAERGRPFFLDSVNNNCQRCHGDASANRGVNGGGPELLGPGGIFTGNQAKDTGVDATRAQFAPPDHGRGFPGDESFSPPPLIEAADTGPWFHTNGVHDVESTVRFYTTAVGLFTGQQQTFGEDRVQDLGAVLRALNASFNAQLALQRIDAALLVLEVAPDHPSVGELLELAAEEAEDGARVLTSPGSREARDGLAECEQFARIVSSKNKPEKHIQQIGRARGACIEANESIGTGLTMQLGSGNLAMRSSRRVTHH